MLLDKLTLLLPKSKRSLDPDSQRKWLTVLLINFLTICIQIFYLYRLNFLHYKPIVNFITIPCLICNLLAFYFYYKNIYFYSALFVILPGTVDLIWLIFMAGGIGAPGVFWIAILPFFYGTFFDKKGAIIGTIITFSTYAFYYIAENYMVMPTVTTTYEAYHREKFTNLINYSLTGVNKKSRANSI